LIRKPDPRKSPAGTAVGADVGATLVKMVIRTGDGRHDLRVAPVAALEQAAREVASARPGRVGLTGGGAPALARLLSFDTTRADEFDAWRLGAGEMLRAETGDRIDRYLLVSLGTGTSAMLVDGARVTRVGGTALGGGTVVGLGAALVGIAGFDELVALAREGDRRNVDLLVSDVYRSGESPLPGGLNASSFAKLARRTGGAAPPAPRDLAHAIMGLVGENVGLICSGLAAAAGVSRIVFGGSTLRGNTPLVEILRVLTTGAGLEAIVLPHGEFAGALGAMTLAREGSGSD
jgi:type II pantothenate kinase